MDCGLCLFGLNGFDSLLYVRVFSLDCFIKGGVAVAPVSAAGEVTPILSREFIPLPIPEKMVSTSYGLRPSLQILHFLDLGTFSNVHFSQAQLGYGCDSAIV